MSEIAHEILTMDLEVKESRLVTLLTRGAQAVARVKAVSTATQALTYDPILSIEVDLDPALAPKPGERLAVKLGRIVEEA